MSNRTIRLVTGLSLPALLALAQATHPEPGKLWLYEFDHAAKQLVSLAEATPAEKFSWRPAPEVRSVAEVYMHVALGNYLLLNQAGVKPPPEVPPLKPGAEKTVTGKKDVIKWLKDSQALVRDSYSKADLQKKTKLFGNETTVERVFLRLLVHNHEHMGQSIAYARMMGVVPPWSERAR